MSSEPIYHIPPDLTIGDTFGTLEAAPTNWGMRATHIDRLRTRFGEGQTVAILDTGLDPDHQELAGRVLANRSFVPGESAHDGNGHGTHCAGTAVGATRTIGVSGLAKLIGGKCLSNSGSGSNTWIRAAYQWAMSSGATVISMSIGGPGFMEGMEDLVNMADARGIVTVLAAGNERQQGGIVRFPSSAIVVAAVDINGRFASFSNPAATNSILSTSAPGVNITSARSGGGYVTMSGTSMATPFVAGVVACLQSERQALGLPPLRNADLKKLFGSRNVDTGTPGADVDTGSGLLDGEMLRLSLVQLP